MKTDAAPGNRGNISAPVQGIKKMKPAKSGLQSFNHWLFQFMAHGQRAEKGEVRNLILDVLSDKARHGYDIIREIAARSEQIYSPSTGVVYPTLHILENSGFVRSYEENGIKLFEITNAGRMELEDNREEVADTYDRLCGHVPALRGESFQAMGKQIDRIFRALRKSFQRGQLGSGKIGDICTVLEEASERIEHILKNRKR